MTESRKGIVTAGTWCVDRNIGIEFWPGEDGLAEIDDIQPRGGGSGCNLACDIRRLDPSIPVETIALVGDDANGRLLLAQADEFGIGRSRMIVAPDATTQCTDAYISRRSGRRTHIYLAGTATLLTPDHFDLDGLTGRFFHLGLPGVHKLMDAPWQGDANGWVTVLKRARAAGLETNLELASVERERLSALAHACLPHLDMLIVNDTEIGAIGGEDTVQGGVTDVEACIRAARSALDQGPMRLVVAHFPLGAVAVTREGAVVHRPSVRVPPEAVVSANGAGDAFAAGVVYGQHQGWSLEDSLSLAHASAAASLRAMSTVDGMASWQECLDLAQRWGWR
ncbi:carbohydrate kinase family protein [Labrys wisconsinensis]|uniref:Sugar/nucleoside kinase (Ribokinase family) n=1 Tax=Labrys wisconsinensis TaxID=425677 RepID=A0ABU0JAA1_9HYPH|nr:carbohydrate kinase family protein [Labrys wisconsinensis]MDQ0471192.1 sugar/nucleoside kinase (ribokinase family) [Labrys wisconsinensis]